MPPCRAGAKNGSLWVLAAFEDPYSCSLSIDTEQVDAVPIDTAWIDAAWIDAVPIDAT